MDDITKLDRSREALEESAERFRQLVDNLNSGVAVFRALEDGMDFEFIDLNRAGECIERVRRADVIGHRVTEVFPSVASFGLLDVLREVHKTGKSQSHPTTLYQDRRIAGWRRNFVYRLSGGDVVAVYEDLTEQKMAELSLRDSEERFRQLTETIDEVFWIGSPNWKGIHYVSPAYEKVWGRPCADLYRRPQAWLESVVDEDRQEIQDALAARATDDPSPMYFPKYRIVRPNGEIRWIHAKAFPVRDGEGNIYRIAGVATDITEVRKAQEELERERLVNMHSDRLRSLGELAAGIAHELNQPLCAVRGQAEHALIALDRGWAMPTEKLREHFYVVMEQADRMANVIEHVRLFSRGADSNRQQLFNVNEAAKAAGELIGFQLRSKGIELAWELDEHLPEIMGNPYALEAVVLNLVGNARDALLDIADGGRGPVCVSTRHECSSDPAQIVLCVRDEGCGMEEATRRRALEPFYTTKSAENGTGLGLPIVKTVVDGFGGRLRIDSKPDVGTTVTVRIPVNR